MAELSGFWTTTGTAAGDQQASYTQAHWSTASRIMSACAGFEGVAPSYLNSLAGTVTGSNTVAINTGGAMVDGKWFINDASQDVNIPSASGGGNTRIDRIVLRASWAGFNVSVTRIAGTDAASPTAPSITQTSGTTYDILLYQALVDTAGTVTLTDERTMADRFKTRQGGSATEWATNGTTTYIPGSYRFQAGTIRWTGSAVAAATKAIVFPVTYTGTPIVVVSAATAEVNASITPAAAGATVRWATTDASTQTTIDFHWIALGPV